MNTIADRPVDTPPYLSIFILSSVALSYEVLLIRLFSIIHWHHFAFMVISIALLGYGASGSLITIFRQQLLHRYPLVFIANILLFGLSSISCFIIIQRLPFNALEILWDSSQWQRLFLTYLLLTLPFLFVANAIALSMMRFHQKIALVYGIDLMGAGLGALSVMVLLQFLSPAILLPVISISGLSAGFFALRSLNHRQQQLSVSLILLCILVVYMIPQQWLELHLSEYKGLSQTLLMKGSRLRQTHSSPVSQTDVVESSFIPFRHAPGLSLQSPAGPPEQLAVFRDGDEMTTIDHFTENSSLEYHDYMSSALPYHIHDSPQNALILASATGAQILQAHAHGIAQIEATEADKQLSQLISDQFADYFGWQHIKHKVTIHNISPRGYAVSAKNYDLVIMGPAGSSAGGAAGVYDISTSYELTVEALQSYLKLLAPEGLLSLTLWTSTPARANLKLFNTAVSALKMSGIEHPEKNMAWIRSWNTATLILKNTPFSTHQINKVREFSESRSFDVAWLPDIKQQEVNRFQLLQKPLYYLTAQSVFSTAESNAQNKNFIQNYLYHIQPATDDRPYFNYYFKWSSLPEFLSIPGQAGLSMIGVGYPTVLITLAQAIVAAFFLIILPLLFIKKDESEITGKRWPVIVYFLSIGLAFLFIELAFIQKFTLILSQPLYAVAVTLCAFLIFSGSGSLYIQHHLKTASSAAIPVLLRRSVLLIGSITVIYIIVIPLLSDTIMALPESLRITSTFLLAAPLAFAMGMPFPLGLASVQQSAARLVPWAWGINGCASVLSAILAVLLAIQTGFNGVMLCAVILYVIAWRNGIKLTA